MPFYLVVALHFALPKNAAAYEEHAAPSPFGWTSSVAVVQGVKRAVTDRFGARLTLGGRITELQDRYRDNSEECYGRHEI